MRRRSARPRERPGYAARARCSNPVRRGGAARELANPRGSAMLAALKRASSTTPSAATTSRSVARRALHARTELHAELGRWFGSARRDLPWRRTRDPYAIWISEAMLQQTRVETVVPYYLRFLARLPDVAALAAA